MLKLAKYQERKLKVQNWYYAKLHGDLNSVELVGMNFAFLAFIVMMVWQPALIVGFSFILLIYENSKWISKHLPALASTPLWAVSLAMIIICLSLGFFY